jgi:hypothetical protein
MRPDREPAAGPSPEDLAAYVDGLLEAPDRKRVEAWLADHSPEAQELADHGRLARLWHTAWPVEPTESAWTLVFQRIEAGFRARRRWRLAGIILGITLPAAAIWLAFVLQSPAELPRQGAGSEEEPYPVATAEEVEIHRLEKVDSDSVLVGEPPTRGNLDLASHGDVLITSFKPYADNLRPDMYTHPEPASSPMIIFPLVLEAREVKPPF